MTILFALVKFLQLVESENPQVTLNLIKDYHQTDEKLLLIDQNGQGNFKIAFALEDYFTKVNLLDPKYLKVAAYLYRTPGID